MTNRPPRRSPWVRLVCLACLARPTTPSYPEFIPCKQATKQARHAARATDSCSSRHRRPLVSSRPRSLAPRHRPSTKRSSALVSFRFLLRVPFSREDVAHGAAALDRWLSFVLSACPSQPARTLYPPCLTPRFVIVTPMAIFCPSVCPFHPPTQRTTRGRREKPRAQQSMSDALGRASRLAGVPRCAVLLRRQQLAIQISAKMK